MSIDVEVIEQTSPLLGRQKVHDERSRAFAMGAPVDRSSWHDKAIRIYDPRPNPNQTVGCCTAVAKAVQLNAVGNRKRGRVIDYNDVLAIYRRNTQLDPFPGTWEPDDTGSSGLASCKTAVEMGLGGEYRWLFGGADEVVQNIVEGRVISIGARWDHDMFHKDAQGLIHLGGGVAGGHQWAARAYDARRDWVGGRCWWGTFRDFWIARADLDTMLRDGGDAHFQKTA